MYRKFRGYCVLKVVAARRRLRPSWCQPGEKMLSVGGKEWAVNGLLEAVTDLALKSF